MLMMKPSEPHLMTTGTTAGDSPRHLILGTAGHIDHGKSTLIKALTGTDTDRLPEEKRRGLTIELGFAELKIGPYTLGVVDVPGHERFVRTMVAGATGIDLALIVVAADDSVMPQTVEHIEILNLLGITHAVVALTKCDLVDAEVAELAECEIEESLENTPLGGAPTVRVSAATGQGLDALREALQRVAGQTPPRDPDDPFRMPVDRVFTVTGRGTIVTGSVSAGRVAVGDVVDIWPIDRKARVRHIQTHGQDADTATVGQRAAINLHGVDKQQLMRGVELAETELLSPTRLVDAVLTCLPSRDRPIKHNARVRLGVGTREVMARCVCLSDDSIAPGREGLVQMRCRESVTVTCGQRFIVRQENASRTIGGGMVLRAARRRINIRSHDAVAGLKQLQNGSPPQRVEQVCIDSEFDSLEPKRVAAAAAVSPRDINALIDQLIRAGKLVNVGQRGELAATAFLDRFLNRAARWLERYHGSHPDEPGPLAETVLGWLQRRSSAALARDLLDRLIATGQVQAMGRYICHRRFAPKLSRQDQHLMTQLLDRLYEAKFQPPTLDQLADTLRINKTRIEKLAKVACATGDMVPIDGTIYLHRSCEQQLQDNARKLAAEAGSFTVAQLRKALNSSRKYAVPMAEYLDRVGLTRRRGDVRVLDDRKPAESRA